MRVQVKKMATVVKPWLMGKAIALLVPVLPGEEIGVLLTPEHAQIVRVLQESHEGAALVEISDKAHTIVAALSVEATAALRAGVGGQDGFVRMKQGKHMPVITLVQYHFVAIPAIDQQQQQQPRAQRLELRVLSLSIVSSTVCSNGHRTVCSIARGIVYGFVCSIVCSVL